MSAGITTQELIAVLLGLSVLIGALIAGIVFIGDRERAVILNSLDKLPGVVAAVLTALSCFAAYGLVKPSLGDSQVIHNLAWLGSVVVSVAVGWRVHSGRRTASAAKGLAGPEDHSLTRIGGR
jgi:membrane associated rhomboid family serine protease